MARLATSELFDHLATSAGGISNAEAAARLKRFGPNRLPRQALPPWYWELGKQFLHLFALLLWIAAALALLAGMPELSAAVCLVVFINGVFSFWQQYRAERAVQALERLLPHQVTVRRNGAEQTLLAEDLALGDVLVLGEGTSVPADARLVRAERLRVDMSSLTGESRPVSRTALPWVPPREGEMPAPAELRNILLAGTFIVAGNCEAVVFATGAYTEFGAFAALTHAQTHVASPLERELRRMTRLISVLAVGMGLLFFGLGYGLGRLTLVEGLVFGLGIIVANVPEGLLPTLSLSLALGVRRMAARRALVKRLECVEALGAASVIVTDKTGTLTLNQMTVRELWVAGEAWQVSGAGFEPEGEIWRIIKGAAPGSAGPGAERSGNSLSPGVVELLRTAALCCDSRLVPPSGNHPAWSVRGDPTEGALLVAAGKAGLNAAALAHFPRLAELPFDSVRKRMTTVQQGPRGALVCTKGALSEVLPRCHQENLGSERNEIEQAAVRLANRGWRVLAVAGREMAGPLTEGNGLALESCETGLTFLGLVAMEDAPRPEVPAAVASCHTAGIRVVMATGDDGHTAAAIAREIGLCESARVITGSELDRLNERSLGLLLGTPHLVFARVTPAHKLRLVAAFQRRGEVVAVTGDGVNDAPALKRADVGVAMGGTGADVAREAADVILLDDNFATIVAAIEEGRAVYDNVRKFVTYIFASNVPEIVPFVAFVLLRIPLPLTVMQILAVDLGTDLVPALALGGLSPEPGIMNRPPRPRKQPLLDRTTLLRAYFWLGAIEALLCLGGFFFIYAASGWGWGEPLAEAGPLYVLATTMSLAGIVACQAGNLLACWSDRESVVKLGLTRARVLAAAIAFELVVLAALVYLPPLSGMFQLAPLEPTHWLVLACFGPLLLAAEEARKAWVRRRVARPALPAKPA